MLQRAILHKKNEGKTLIGYQFISEGYFDGREIISLQRPKTCISRKTRSINITQKENNNPLKQESVKETYKQSSQQKQITKCRQKKVLKSKKKTSLKSNRMEEYLSDFRALKNSEITKVKIEYLMEKHPSAQLCKKNSKIQVQSAKSRENSCEVEEALKQIKEKIFTKETIISKSWILASSSKIHSGLFILNLGSKKYQRISQELMTTLFQSQICGLKWMLKFMNKFSTQLQENIFYCLFSLPHHLIQNLSTNFYFKDSHIRFFLINRPIHHSERATIRSMIAEFLVQNYSFLRQERKLSSENADFDANSVILVVDNRGCVSIIRNEELNGTFFQNNQLFSLNEKITQKRLEETEIDAIIENFSKACKFRLNLQIAHINCLFSKGPL